MASPSKGAAPPFYRVLAVDQHDAAVVEAGTELGFQAPDALCGFLSIANAIRLLSCDNNETTPSPAVAAADATVLDAWASLSAVEMADAVRADPCAPWFLDRRVAYVEAHPDEFVADGTAYADAGGKLSATAHRTLLASTPVRGLLALIGAGVPCV